MEPPHAENLQERNDAEVSKVECNPRSSAQAQRYSTGILCTEAE